MHLASTIRSVCRLLPRQEFVARFAHPWLLRELSEDEAHVDVTHGRLRKITGPDGTTQLRLPVHGSMRLLWRLEHGSDRIGAMPIVHRTGPALDHVLIGRASSNDLVLPDPSVSKVHAVLVDDGGGSWSLVDLGSTNGVYVNRRRITPHQPCALTSGASLDFGSQHCEFIDSDDLHQTLSRGTTGPHERVGP